MATIYDVAKRANVSPATVSNAFNKPNMMRPETRDRIMEIADALDYRPNVNARALAGGKSQLVGLLIGDIRIPYIANVTRGIEDRLAENGFIAVVSSTDGKSDKTLSLLKNLKRSGVGGFIFVPAKFGIPPEINTEITTQLAQGVNIIVAGHELNSDDIPHLAVRGQQSSREIVDHLLELGHRDIAFITGHHSQGEGIWRWFGYQHALLARGIPIRPELVKEIDGNPQTARQAVEELMALPNPPTAIFAMNDIYARGVIDYVVTNNIRLPEDLSVVTYDYQVLAQRITPRLTSVLVPAYDLGWKAAELFLALQANPDHTPRVEELIHQIEDRGSTGAPRIT